MSQDHWVQRLKLLQGPSRDSWGLFSQFLRHCIWGLLSEQDLSLGTSTVGRAEEWEQDPSRGKWSNVCVEQSQAPQAVPSLFQPRST